MELLGLAIAVSLILLIAIFVTRFLLLKSPSDSRKGFVEKELATSMVNTILNTNSDCKNLKFSDIIVKCYEGGAVECGSPPQTEPCKYAETEIKKIFSETLDKWHQKYQFIFYKQNQGTKTEISIKTEDCFGKERSRRPGTFVLPTNSGSTTVVLYICN